MLRIRCGTFHCSLDVRFPDLLRVLTESRDDRQNHGFTCMAAAIEECVSQAYFIQENARIQTTSLTLRGVYLSGPDVRLTQVPEISYLSNRQRMDARHMAAKTCMRPWVLWRREVEAHPVYIVSFRILANVGCQLTGWMLEQNDA